uniref:Uncharacterized protein n=1 Tax=Anguilla anguilla TaxID=7936 RepID=A0A0E9RU62_ANGAN
MDNCSCRPFYTCSISKLISVMVSMLSLCSSL